MGPKALDFIHSFARKYLTKGQGSGITKIPGRMEAEAKASEIASALVDAGLDFNKMDDFIRSEADVAKYLNILEAAKRERMRTIPANSSEGKRITEQLFGKKGDVVDMTGKKIDTRKGIMGGKSIEDLMDSGQVSKGARGMKKSKKVQDREMFQAANERLTSDVDTIVKNIKRLSPMDAMKEANLVIGRKGYYKNLTPEQSKKILKDTEDHIFERDIPEEDFAKGGRAGFFKGAVAGGENISPGTDTKGNVRNDNPFTGGGEGENNNPPPVSTNNTTPDTTFFDKTSKSGLMSNISPSILARLARIKKGITPIIGEDVGLQYQNTDELNDIFTNFRITQDLENLIKTKKLEPELKYRKEIGDNTLIEGGINQAGDANIMFKKQFADGGRANFVGGGMGRRGFLKMLAGLGGGIAAAKTGILKLAGKEPVKQVAKEVVQKSTTTPPPYFFKLAEKIKMLGADATATTERVIAKSLKSKDGKSEYLLEEDVTTGDTIIKKINKEGDEMITDVEIMEFKKGEVVQGKDGKAMKTPDEYEEVTEANARIEGDVFNDPYYTDGIQVDEIMKEVGEQAPSIKKADGGRIPYFKGGLAALKTLMNYFAKEKGTTGSKLLSDINPKKIDSGIKNLMSKEELNQLKENRTEYVKHLLNIIKSDKKFLDNNRELVEEAIAQAPIGMKEFAKEMSESIKRNSIKENRLERLSVYDKVNPDDAIMDVEMMIKNMSTGKKDKRALNATGGVARLLGE